MTLNDLMFRVVGALEQMGVKYMLVGSFSSNAYGIPRSTNDVDFVIESEGVDTGALASLLKPDVKLDPQLQFETITGTSRYIAHDVDGEYAAELFLLTDDPHHRERFARRRQAVLHGRPVWIPTAEDVIIQKLKWYVRARRSKDIEDVRDVLNVQAAHLDLDYLRLWCDRHGTRQTLEDLLAEDQGI